LIYELILMNITCQITGALKEAAYDSVKYIYVSFVTINNPDR